MQVPAKLAAQSALSNSGPFMSASYPDLPPYREKLRCCCSRYIQTVARPIGIGAPPPGPKAINLPPRPIGTGAPPPGPKAINLPPRPIGTGAPPPGPKAISLPLWPIGTGAPPPGPKAINLPLWPIGTGAPPPGPEVAAEVSIGNAAKDRRPARIT